MQQKKSEPTGDYKLPDNLEKNCAPNFSPSLDTNKQKEDSFLISCTYSNNNQ